MKIASRCLIPLELYLGVVLFSWGLAGWWNEGGGLWRALEKLGQSTEWGLVLCALGALQVTAALVEACLGRRWPNEQLLWSVRARFWLAFCGLCVWLYVVYFLMTMRGVEILTSLGLQAPAGVVFSLVCFIGNQRVATVLNPAVPTERLQRTIIADRADLLRQ